MAQKYYVLGASWKGYSPEDQTKRFVEQGIWKNENDTTLANTVNTVEVGARVAIKSTYTRGQKHSISSMKIKSLGTVVENLGDGKTLQIHWDTDFEPFTLDHATYMPRISRVLNKKNIRDIFFHGTDYIEEKVARLCWNTNGWIKPSGPIGKSTSKKAYENENCFGHEEWLFDFDKLIDGYHYGFLQQAKGQAENIFDVLLYTVDGTSKKRYFVASIKGMEIVSKEESEQIFEIYKSKGWKHEMEQQVKNLRPSKKTLGFSASNLFNIKFRPDNAVLYELSDAIPENNSLYKKDRYLFYPASKRETDILEDKPFDPDVSGENNTNTANAGSGNTRTQQHRVIELDNKHCKISDRLTLHLEGQYQSHNVQINKPTGCKIRTLIDIYVNDNGNRVFYEIKALNSARASIREAMGQLMEYSMWSERKDANKMIIVTDLLEDSEEGIKYIKHIRETYNIPVYYQIFDLKTDLLSNEY